MSAPRARLRRGVVVGFAAALAVLFVFALGQGVAGAQEASFGISSFAVSLGSPQAGAHADLTTRFMLHTNEHGEPAGQLRDVHLRLAPGIIGGASSIPQCSPVEFELYACQPPAQVGVMTLFEKIGAEPAGEVTAPVYNISPSAGHLATFAASLLTAKIVIQADFSQDGAYALEVAIHDLSTEIPITGTSLTLWGVPASSKHDLERSRSELGGPELEYGPPNEFGEREVIGVEPTPAGVPPTPLLSNPSDCGGPELSSALQVDSWGGEADQGLSTVPAPSGCELLGIAPAISVKPETTMRDTPSGYEIDLSYPLDEQPFDLATPPLREATVVLPPGVSLSPAVASGLVGCTDAEFQDGGCPETSKVGTATIDAPQVANPLHGAIYLSAPTPAAMYRLLIAVAGEGVSVRLVGVVHPDPVTGQLTVIFSATPQLPFAALDLHLFGGARAPLANPATCGEARTTAELVSYGAQSASASSSFEVDADGTGRACPSPSPFTPGFLAGTLSARAGSSSPLTLSVSRQDGQQTLGAIATSLPPGLTGLLAKVPLCGEPAAALGNCPQSSLVGTAKVGAGAGASPLGLTGSVYLTGPYRSAPFGLEIVVPAIAGPFDLGTIILRAQVKIAPGDMHLMILTEPPPQILSGIPLRIRTIDLEVNRPGFMLNPTNCSPMSVAASIDSAQGASFAASSPFQVSGCRGLPFAPKLTATTPPGARSRGDGAGFDMRLTNAAGAHANLQSLAVDLPKPLKARLSAVQQACLAATFAKNPAACPPDSTVGSAKVDTPVLSTPLAGPVYMVYYRGIKYPKLVLVLQSSGVEVQLTGTLNVAKGIIDAKFGALPDIPIGLLELNLPEGAHSALGATHNLCAKARTMPHTATGQNGTQRTGTTRVVVQGCRRHVG